MRIFHIATAADWAAARRVGSYTTSTRGRSLAEEGFVHASRGDQWQGVRDRFYADATEPLVLLVIETARLTSPVVEESVPDSTETYPHIYGPVNADAVVSTIVLDGATPTPPRPQSFLSLYLREVYRRIAVAVAVMFVVVLAILLGTLVDRTWGGLVGAVVAFIACVVVVRRTRLLQRIG